MIIPTAIITPNPFKPLPPRTTPPTILTASWRIGKIFGVPTDLHWSFLLLPPAILYFTYLPGVGVNWLAAGFWSAVAVLIFIFILVHELGHALAARNRGVVAERIILFPLGGGAYIPEQPRQLWAEVLVYAAGPLANIALAGLAYGLLVIRPEGHLLVDYYLQLAGNMVVLPNLWERVLGLTFSVNLLLALGNLLPAYPLDGGRILRALLRQPLGARPATVVVTVLGVIIGSALAYLGWRTGDPLLGLGAAFIVALSVLEFRSGWQRRRLAGHGVARVLRPVDGHAQPFVSAYDTVATAQKTFAATNWPVLPVRNRWNQLVGFVERELLEDEAQADELVMPYAEAEFVTARDSENLLVITERIVDANVYGAAVYDAEGKLAGYVFTEDVMTVLG